MENTLSQDLTLIIILITLIAGICFLFKLPSLIGYILIGILIGPIFQLIDDSQTIINLGELGILFMMFFVGLEFNLNKLKKVLAPATSAIILQTSTMITIGIVAAKFMGLSDINGFFLGGILCISSTIVLIELINNKSDMRKEYAHLSIGILILEDLLAILMLVFLSGVAITNTVEWSQMWHIFFLLITFVVVIFVFGKIFLSPILQKININGTYDIVMFFALALIFGLGEAAVKMEFSVALGAFLAGSIISGTPVSREVKKILLPFKNLFVALFFISVGMMINPYLIYELFPTIFILSLCVIFGQSLSCFLGAIIAGVNPRIAWIAGINKARIGEFSFVIAALGNKLGVISPSISAIAMGVAFITIFINPIIASQANLIADIFEKLTPKKINSSFKVYENILQLAKKNMNGNHLIIAWHNNLTYIFIYSIIFSATMFSSNYMVKLDIIKNSQYSTLLTAIVWFLAGIVIIPFVFIINKNIGAMLEILISMLFPKRLVSYKERLTSLLSKIFYFATMGLCIFIYITCVWNTLPIGTALIFLALSILIITIIFYKYFLNINSKLEYAFVENFNNHLENDEDFKREKILKQIKSKYPWPIDLHEVVVPRGAECAGKTIAELAIRNKSGASIVAIEREGFARYDLNANNAIYPGDMIILIGTKAQTLKADDILSKKENNPTNESEHKFSIEYIFAGQSSLTDKTLAQINPTKTFGTSIVGIQRGKTQIISPGANEQIKNADILLVVGRKEDIEKFRNHIEL